jgi:hypothetical protein
MVIIMKNILSQLLKSTTINVYLSHTCLYRCREIAKIVRRYGVKHIKFCVIHPGNEVRDLQGNIDDSFDRIANYTRYGFVFVENSLQYYSIMKDFRLHIDHSAIIKLNERNHKVIRSGFVFEDYINFHDAREAHTPKHFEDFDYFFHPDNDSFVKRISLNKFDINNQPIEKPQLEYRIMWTD